MTEPKTVTPRIALAVSPDGRWCAVGSSGSIYCGDVKQADGKWRGSTLADLVIWGVDTEAEARAVVEAAVRKALGWE